MVRLSRVTLLIAEPGSDKSEVLRSAVMPILTKRARGAEAEISILFDQWNEPPLPALHARVRQAAGTAGAAVSEPGGGSLLANLREWQEALDVTFIIVFDRFEQFLAAAADRAGFAEFEETFVQIANDPMLRANFLLAFDEEAEPLLARLKRHIPRLGNSRVRLPRMRHAADAGPAESSARAHAAAMRAAPAARADEPAPIPEATPAMTEGTPAIVSTADNVPAAVEPARERESSIVARTTRPHVDERAPDTDSPRAAASEWPDTRARERTAPELARGAFRQRLRRIGWAPLLLIPAAWFLFGQPADRGERDAPPRDTAGVSKGTTSVAPPRAAEKSAGEQTAAVPSSESPRQAAGGTAAKSAAPDASPRAEVAAPKPPPPPPPRAEVAAPEPAVVPPPPPPPRAEVAAPKPAVVPPSPPAPRAEVAAPKPPVVPPPPPPRAEVAPPKAPAPARVEAAPPKIATAPPAPRNEPAPPQPVTKPVPPRAEMSSSKPSPATAPPPKAKPDAGAQKAPAPPPRVATAAPKPAPQPEVPANAPSSAAAVPPPRAPAGPVLHILVRNEAQRTRAQQLIGPLKERGIHVAGVRIVPPSADTAHIRYYRLNDRNEAMRVALALRDVGLSAQQLKQMPEPDTSGPGRLYELWLP